MNSSLETGASGDAGQKALPEPCFQQKVDIVTPHLALADAAEHGVLLEMVKHPEAKRGFMLFAQR
jgi:hypothetical protein